jgi:hypothetical protein
MIFIGGIGLILNPGLGAFDKLIKVYEAKVYGKSL